MNDNRYKFRAWNKEKKEMWYMDNPYHCSLIVSKIGDQGNELLPLELMQCTGILDKNGKLIYTGDIIKLPDRISKINYEVYWVAGEFRLAPRDCKMPTEHDKTKGFSYARVGEIIGNIADNPELMEVKE